MSSEKVESSSTKACYEPFGVSGYAVAFRLTRSEPINIDAIKEMGNKLMLRIASYCIEKGAKFIGHIKSYMKTKHGYLKADTIGLEKGVYVESSITEPITQAYLVINSIVQGIDKSQVKMATLEASNEVLLNYGFNIEIEKEHEYFDKFDIPIQPKEEERKKNE
ncbi:MAG: hypothetical protein QXL52_03085 [Nitrososphaerales archaeon]